MGTRLPKTPWRAEPWTRVTAVCADGVFLVNMCSAVVLYEEIEMFVGLIELYVAMVTPRDVSSL